MEKITVYLNKVDYRRLKALAKEAGRPVPSYSERPWRSTPLATGLRGRPALVSAAAAWAT